MKIQCDYSTVIVRTGGITNLKKMSKGENMKNVSILLIAFAFIMGCSGNYGSLKSQPEEDSKVTQQELIDNWTNYSVYFTRYGYAREAYGDPFRATLIVFDPKNDDREILVGKYWGTVKNQETWTEIVKANTTTDGDNRSRGAFYDWPSGVEEIWGPDNEFYAFIIYQTSTVDSIYLELADEKTIRVSWYRRRGRGNPVLVK